jgi:hypothetical protein
MCEGRLIKVDFTSDYFSDVPNSHITCIETEQRSKKARCKGVTINRGENGLSFALVSHIIVRNG